MAAASSVIKEVAVARVPEPKRRGHSADPFHSTSRCLVVCVSFGSISCVFF